MNVSQKNINKLQKLQNSAARLVLGKNRRFSGTSALSELHWLNVDARIVFKILLIVFKVVNGICSENIQLQVKHSMGRAGDDILLETPHYKTKFGRRIFDFNGSRLWNALPNYLRAEKDIDKFKKCLKTLLFKNCDQIKDRAYKFVDM